MIKYIPSLILLLILNIASCFQDINLTLDITKAEWSAVLDNGFGEIHLKIAGKTSGDNVTIETHGDGLISEYELELDDDGNFDEDVIISFTSAPDDTARKYNTVVKAYKYSAVNKVSLESPELNFY